ncbi:leucyl aminopeptidase family protein [Pelagimonas varians]|uniref:Peptidase B n=1 Tax=Pelagimonas varians TaxID=696760 RepID=A0A238K9X2_9RHOB|nr:leucyl aminopeptidase family protein [Pelagimonas varians]PYG31131.1 leucyl aminopeptidase [Pelagimonas varians]SMX39698.1 Peptidase B [Pelagimonas varians]
MTLTFATPDTPAIPLHVLSSDRLDGWLQNQSDQVRAWIETNGFTASLGSALMLPGADGQAVAAVVGYGAAASRKRGRFNLAASVPKLAPGVYALAGGVADDDLETECLGWLLESYQFETYRKQSGKLRQLIAPKGVDAERIQSFAISEALTRDLINTPAADMGPDALENAVQTLASQFGAQITVTKGDDLLESNLPMIHAVGRAAQQAPRLLDLRWGEVGPKLTLVGKGVCFDTGGLNLKPGASMGLMKKDMGGAANVIALARMIMQAGLAVQLRVLIPAVENAVSGNSFRPGDILMSRKGLTVEINNTDAEGRLVLADALALGDEDNPDMIVSMATLTGAARVAVGPDLSPFYCDDDELAAQLSAGGGVVADPLWRMPFWEPYEAMIEPGIADLDNAPAGGFAGSITAALFLRRFVTETPRYVHFDIYGWQPKPAPARTKGGFGQGTRAIFEALPKALGL